MNDLEFADKAQDYLPDELISELTQMIHSVNITLTCEGHALLGYILTYGTELLKQQIGAEEIQQKVWPALKQMARDVNDAHVQSIGEFREKYPEACAIAEEKAQKAGDELDHKLELLKKMLGDSQN